MFNKQQQIILKKNVILLFCMCIILSISCTGSKNSEGITSTTTTVSTIPSCTPNITVGDFDFCIQTTDSSYTINIIYNGDQTIDLAQSSITLNGTIVDLSTSFDQQTKSFAVLQTGVSPNKYSYLFRLKSNSGVNINPLFIPFWIGSGIKYSDFTWKDAIAYQIMTDRFINGDPANDIDNSVGTLAEVTDSRKKWQGGDFQGIIDKIDDNYFDNMGINTIVISSPLLNSHNSQPAVDTSDPTKSASYKSIHPIVSGYTHVNNYGYNNPVESAFGTSDKLHELINKAHAKGIRVITEFIANHVQIEAQIYQDNPDWFYSYIPCHNNWDTNRLDCWFTTYTPDFNYSNADVRKAMTDHALWLIQEFNFDGFMIEPIKHVSDLFIQELKTAIVNEIETTVSNHDVPVEPATFFILGESSGDWSRYHVRVDMAQGQIDIEYYNNVKNSLLTFTSSLLNLASFTIPNDTAYLTPQPSQGGTGGYPGAIMGIHLSNHNNWRPIVEAGGDYNRLLLGLTFLLTSPGNMPIIFQGNEIGQYGDGPPDNHKMMEFTGLSVDEQATLDHVKTIGLLRASHEALRSGTREIIVDENWFSVYKISKASDEIYVAINRDADKAYTLPSGFTDGLGNYTGTHVPSLKSCIFVK